MIAYLSIQRFYVRTLGMEDCDNPVVVTRKHRVLDMNLAAERRLIGAEMSSRDAKASLMGGTFLEWKPEVCIPAQRSWLDLAIDFSDVVEPDEQHSTWIDLSAHPDPIATYRALLDAIPHSRGGLSTSKWCAKLACQRHDISLKSVFEPLEFISEVPIHEIEPILPAEATRLEFLGYPTAGRAREIPMEALQRQFGDRALILWNAFRGHGHEPVRAVYPDRSAADRIYFSAGIDDLAVIENSLLRLSQRIAEKLSGDDLFGSRMQIALELEDHEPLIAERTYTKPLHNRRSIYFSAKRLFDGLAPQQPITGIRIRIPELEKKVRHQQSFEHLAVREKASRAEMALRCVRKSYGDASILLGSDIEVPRRLRVLKEWRNATGWL